MFKAYKCLGGSGTFHWMPLYNSVLSEKVLNEQFVIFHIGPWYHVPKNYNSAAEIRELNTFIKDIKELKELVNKKKRNVIVSTHVATHFIDFKNHMKYSTCAKSPTKHVYAYKHVINTHMKGPQVNILDMYDLTKTWPHPGPSLNHKNKTGDCLHLIYDPVRWKHIFDKIEYMLPKIKPFHGNYDPIYWYRSDTLLCIPPKCGSTSLKSWLFDVPIAEAHTQLGNAVRWNDKPTHTPKLSVALIRPYEERFLSAFYNKVWCNSIFKDFIVTAWVRNAFGQECFYDPNDFALRMSLLKPENVDQHFRPQYDVCGENIITKYMYRLEFKSFVSFMSMNMNKASIPYIKTHNKYKLDLKAKKAISEFYKNDISFAVQSKQFI
jgi:hypothetical protein